jgi:hypothetical protein
MARLRLFISVFMARLLFTSFCCAYNHCSTLSCHLPNLNVSLSLTDEEVASLFGSPQVSNKRKSYPPQDQARCHQKHRKDCHNFCASCLCTAQVKVPHFYYTRWKTLLPRSMNCSQVNLTSKSKELPARSTLVAQAAFLY